MNRDSWQAVRAVFLAAIMVLSVFAAGVAFSGTAAAEVTEINDLAAEDVRAGESVASQEVTLTDINNTQGQLGDITIDFEGNPDITIKSVELVGSGDFGDESVDVGARNGGGIFVTIDESATATSNITIQVTLDTTNATPGTVTYTADAAGGATASGDFRVKELGIEHDPNTAGTTFGSSFHAEDLRIISANGNSISFGSDSTLEFRIENSSGSTVTIEPQSGEQTVAAEEFEFEIYDQKGVTDDSAKVFADRTEINVTVSGDTEMFAAGVAEDSSSKSDPFEEYTVSLVDSSGDNTIDSTGPRLIAIGYNIGEGIVQNSTTGNVEFTIPRASLNNGFDESWSAEFAIRTDDNEFGPVDVTNEAGSDAFQVTVDVSDIPADNHTGDLALYRTEETTSDFSDRIISLVRINEVEVSSSDSDDGSGDESDGVLTVDADGGADSYETVSGALQNAEDGDTVRVENGTYTNAAGLTITTANVTLTAAEGASPTFSTSPDSASGTAAIDVQADGVTVSGLTVERVAAGDRATDSGHAQGIIVRSSNATVENNDVVGDLSATSNEFDLFDGITVIDDSTVENVDVVNNDISGFDTGIVVTTFYGGAVSDVTISDNNATNNRVGFVAKAHDGSISGVSGSNNDFTGNDAESIVFSPESYQSYTGLQSVPTTAVSFDGPVLVEEGDSIQTAVDVAAEGATISVGPGTYNEQVIIDSAEHPENLSIVAADGAEETKIAYETPEDKGSGNQPTITVASDGTTVEDFTIERTTAEDKGKLVSQALRAEADDVTLIDNIYTATTGGQPGDSVGLYVSARSAGTVESEPGAVDITIDGGEITGSDIGLAVESQTDGEPANSVDVTFEGTVEFNNNDIQVVEFEGNSDVLDRSSLLAESNTEFDLAASPDDPSDGFLSAFSDIGADVFVSSEIQTAVSTANSGSTVPVISGTYEETVEIDTRNITLTSTAGAANTEIEYAGGDKTPTVDIVASNVTVDGFTIERIGGNRYSQGVAVRATDSVQVSNNIIVQSGNASQPTQGILVTDDSGNPATDTVIGGNEIRGFGHGIAISTQAGGGISRALVDNNTIQDNVVGIKISDFTDTNEEISALVIGNEISSNEDGIRVLDDDGVGPAGTETAGNANLGTFVVRGNNIVDNTNSGITHEASGDDNAIDAALNWWGSDRGPNADSTNGVEGDGAPGEGLVVQDPFLTTQKENLEVGLAPDEVVNTTQFAQDVTAPAGQDVTAVGFPGPVPEGYTVGDAFEDVEGGAIYEYDRQADTFVQVTGSEDIDALDAFIVTQNSSISNEDTQVVIEYADTSDDLGSPRTKTIEPGFNLIGAPALGDSYTVFNAPTDREVIYGTYGQPSDLSETALLRTEYADKNFIESTFGPEQDDPVVSPYGGYLVYTEEQRSITTYVQTGTTAAEVIDNLNQTAA
jgi:surface glycoprotein (TIGR04207 family)